MPSHRPLASQWGTSAAMPLVLALASRSLMVWDWLLACLLILMREARGASLEPSPHLITCGGGDAPCSASPPLYSPRARPSVDDPRHGPRLISACFLPSETLLRSGTVAER